MNKKINELMLKAIYDVDHIYDPIDNPLNDEVSKMYIPDCFAEKFAELIVQECANFLKDTLDDYFAAEQLEEHFGVKE